MNKNDKLLLTILLASSDSNISFSSLCKLLIHKGFNERVKGDHHIFTREGVIEIVNIQPVGNKAKAYQIKQVRNIFVKYKIGSINV